MNEKLSSANPFGEVEKFEKRKIGPLNYKIHPSRIGPRTLNFEGCFVIGGFTSEGEDFRDVIASEGDRIRTDANLSLPANVELEEGEGGVVFFTLPGSKIRGVIYKIQEGDRIRGDYWVQIATPELLAKLEKRGRQQEEDAAAKELSPQKQIERLVRLGRDDEAKKLARELKRDLDYAIAVRQRDAKKK